MNKKLLITLVALVGLVSIFMPWFSFMRMNINAVSEDFNDGYFFGACFVGIMVIMLLNISKDGLGKKATIGTVLLAGFVLVFTIVNLFVNKEFLDMGASLGMGAYTCLISSGFIAIYTFYLKKTSNGDEDIKFDKDAMMSATKKGVDMAKAVGKVAGRVTKSAVEEVKKELQDKKDNTAEGNDSTAEGNDSTTDEKQD